MPRPDTLPQGVLRFFARVDRFTCECPRCGQLIQAHFDRSSGISVGEVRRKEAQRKTIKLRGRHLTYNPLTSRLTCPRCRRLFAVGLLLYPVQERSRQQQPQDTQPTYKQLLALRQLQGGGFLVNTPIRGRDSVNLAVQGTCTCTLVGRWDALRVRPSSTCPVHGWEEQLGPTPTGKPTGEVPTVELDTPIGGEEEEP